MTTETRERVPTAGAEAAARDNGRPPAAARRRGSWWLRGVAVAALLAAVAWAYAENAGGSGGGMDAHAPRAAASAAFPVTTALVVPAAIVGTVTYTGSVAALNEEEILPRVTGRIVEMPVYPGDTVRAGQVVARLDDVELTSRVREAEASAAAADAGRAQMEADVLAARHGVAQMERELAMVEAEQGYAATVAARSEHLFAVGAIARQERDGDQSMATSLAAKRAAADAKLAQARAMETAALRKLEAGRAMAAQGRAALRTATVMRDYVTITAPTSGAVVKRLVAPGVLVQPGMAILKIAQIDRVRLQAHVGERDLPRLRVGMPVAVTLADGIAPTVRTRVTSVFPFVDPGARTAVVEALVDNAGRRYLPGQYVRMEFVTGERLDALGVPRTAVERRNGRAAVWVVKDDRAERRDVEVGLEGADAVEITSGLVAGERVVSRGREGLYPGARVAESGATPPRPATAPAKGGTDGHAGH
jgi:multidrug efflux pump subunit AcrA (membrane-fusion protein)